MYTVLYRLGMTKSEEGYLTINDLSKYLKIKKGLYIIMWKLYKFLIID
jgi:hypothetical protein